MPVGLRIAHGEMFQESALIDDRVLRGIDDCVDPMDALLNTQIRLLGISGLTNDMRELQTELREHDDRWVRLAIEVFRYRARKYIGAYLAGMGGAGAVVFTGGVGENSPEVRARICSGMEWAGLHLDPEKNLETVGREGQISQATPNCSVMRSQPMRNS